MGLVCLLVDFIDIISDQRMNKFRHVQDPRKHIRHEQMQLIGILDKCTQILREDRIYIRNKIKQSDEEVLSFFRPAKHINMQQLQINLRKYLNQVKANLKMQQLIKFKENYLEGCFPTEGEGRPKGHKGGSIGKSRPHQLKDTIREMTNVVIPIPNEKCCSKPTFTRENRCSSLTTLPRPKPTSDIRKSTNRSSEKKLPAMSKHVHFQNDHSHHSLQNKKAPQPQQKHSRTNSSHDIRSKKEQIRKKIHESAGKEIKEEPRESSSNLLDWRNVKSGAASAFQSTDPHEVNHYRLYSSQDRGETLPYTTTEGNQKKYRGPTYEDLFTSPELLRECRKFIEKNKQPLPRLSIQDLPSNSYNFLKPSSTFQKQQFISSRLPEPQSNQPPQPSPPRAANLPPSIYLQPLPEPTATAYRDPEQISPIHEQLINSPGDGTIEIIQINLDSKTETQRNNTSKQQPIQPLNDTCSNNDSNLPDLSEYYAEDIIDIMFYNKDGAYLKASDYAYTVYSNFAETQPFERAYELADLDKDGRVSVQQLGELLEKAAKKKANPTREFFDLIDLDKVGRVTQEEYHRFLHQISESEQAEFEKVRKSAEKVFQFADYERRGFITYWGVYLIKSTWEFQEFSSYLEQFEFSIEP